MILTANGFMTWVSSTNQRVVSPVLSELRKEDIPSKHGSTVSFPAMNGLGLASP